MKPTDRSSDRRPSTGSVRALLGTALLLLLPVAAARAGDVSWMAAVDGVWSDGSKWTGGSAPGPLDTAIIDADGSYTVTLDASPTIAGIRLGGSSGTQVVAATAHTVTVSDSIHVAANGRLDLSSAAIGGVGLVVNEGQLRLLGAASIGTPVVNAGSIHAAGTGNSIAGALATESGSVLRVDAGITPAHSDLTITNGFTNHGLVEIVQTTYAGHLVSRLNVTNGTLVNAADGTISCPVGYNRGNRFLGAEVDNQGMMSVAYTLTMDRPSCDHDNAATIDVSGGDLTITQSGTTPTFGNSGTIAIAAGRTLTLDGGELHYNPGQTTGDGRFRVTNVTALYGVYLPAGSADFLLDGGNTVDAITSADLVLASRTGNVVGDFTANAGSVLRVDAGITPAHSDLTITNGFTNHGLVEIVQTTYAGHLVSRLNVTNGTLVNAADGTISCPVGYNRGNRFLGAEVDNQGLLSIDYSLTAQSGPLTNGPTGTIQGDATLDVSTVSFTDAGTAVPGFSPGVLTITGDDPRGVSSALNVEIGGLTPGTEYDRLAVSGLAGLDGGLNVSLIDGFVPALGDSFFIVTAGSRIGEFASATGLELPNKLQFEIDYRTDAVVLRAGPPPVNDPPLATADSASTPEDLAVDIDVLANDNDANGDSLSVVPGAFSGPAHGSVSLNPDQTIHYVPAPDFFGADSLTYVVSDQVGGLDTASVYVAVTAVNDPPQFVGPTPPDGAVLTIPPGGTAPFTVTASDIDSGDVVTLDVVGLPAGAVMTPPLPASANPVTSGFLWTPTYADLGSHEITFTATDGELSAVPRTVTVVVESPTSTIISRLRANPTDDGIEVTWRLVEGGTIAEQRLERSLRVDGPWLPIGVALESDAEDALDRAVDSRTEYFYRLRATTSWGQSLVVGPVSATSLETITAFALSPVAPNPTRGVARVEFAVPREARVEIAVFDVAGRRVATLADDRFEPGRYQLQWDGEARGRSVVPGVYFVRFASADVRGARRIVVVR